MPASMARRPLRLWDGEQVEVRWPIYDADDIDDGEVGDTVRAPINGVARVFVAEGDTIVKGELAVVEAMKMEHVLHACATGSSRVSR